MTTKLIDAAAAAEILGVKESWVRRQARAGAIPHVPLGRYVRFDPDDLEAWWQSRKRGPDTRRLDGRGSDAAG